MASSIYMFFFIRLFFLLSFLHLILTHSPPFMQPLCHDDESSALLQFKESFVINKFASPLFVLNKFASPYYPLACEKVASWTLEGDKSDCCSWDGVECDEDTGHVIGLDLSRSCLFGSINSNSSLFRLGHLQRLNLAYNHFNYSPIPPQVRNLSRLTYLNLNESMFSGQIPFEISQLSHLTFLHLCSNINGSMFYSGKHLLELKKPDLPSLIGNLTRLQNLGLDGVGMISTIPTILANFSSLTSLYLDNCGLYGEFPVGIFKLPNLRVLQVGYNEGLLGYLPNFTWSSPLEALALSATGFSGELPPSIGNLSYLNALAVFGCNFTGSIPSSLGNLTNLTLLNLSNNTFKGEVPSSIGNLNRLSVLDLSQNQLTGFIPSSLGNLTNLTALRLSNNTFKGEVPSSVGNLNRLFVLDLSQNQLTGPILFHLVNLMQLKVLDLHLNHFTGEIPVEILNLTELTYLSLGGNKLQGPILFHLVNLMQLKFLGLQSNHFTGEIPAEILNLTELTYLSLGENKLQGRIPNSIFNLTNLQFLDLDMNYFSGTVEFDEFVKLKHLTTLDLSYNQFSLLFKEPNANATFPKFQNLALSSCNLSKFPDFLRSQDELEYLDLSDNNLAGPIPEWMLNVGKTSLQFICLANNSLTGFAQHPILLPWTRLAILDLRFNLLQGSLPIPVASNLKYYGISNNSLTGNVPALFCNLSSLRVLDLASNNLTGSLPQCFDNFGASLLILNLQRNKFQGSIPDSWVKGSQLKIIIFSQNQFQGRLPRLLLKCTMLKVLDLGNNQFNDIFPSWLENLPNLEVLILRSNKFKGPIKTSKGEYMFPNLQIIDLSYNRFVGKLPLELFGNLKVRKSETADHLTYIHVDSNFTLFFKTIGLLPMSYGYDYTMTMTNKGTNMFFEKVQELFIAIDLSSNRFFGEISNSIENLRGCHLLNLSNNILTGHIPPSIGNLVELETLDLSRNKLSGEIPQELTQLTFLEVFNVSHNNLAGPVPQGKQLSTFEVGSFEGNSGLCGKPLAKKCDNFGKLPYPSSVSERSKDCESLFEFGWKIVVIGYAFGLVLGVIIGCTVITRKYDWLKNTLRIR